MPTMFIITPIEGKAFDFIKAFDLIAKHTAESKMLTNCGCKIILQDQHKKILIVIDSVYCFNSVVNQEAFNAISDYLKLLNLREYFHISSIKTSPKPFLSHDFDLGTIQEKEEKVFFTITLKTKIQGLSLYRHPNHITNDIALIREKIEEFSGKNLRMNINYDHDKEIYKLGFINLKLDSQESLLQFKKNIVFRALKQTGFDQDYQIDDFDFNEYIQQSSKSIRSSQSENFNKNQQISSQFISKDEDSALYENANDSQIIGRNENKDTKNQTSANYINSPLNSGENAHNALLRLLEPYKDERVFQGIFESIQEKNYSQALRRACSKQNKNAVEVIKVILYFKNQLPVNINEQPAPKKLGAIHHAALNNKEAYNLLIQHGAYPDLKDEAGVSANEYYIKHFKDSIIELQN